MSQEKTPQKLFSEKAFLIADHEKSLFLIIGNQHEVQINIPQAGQGTMEGFVNKVQRKRIIQNFNAAAKTDFIEWISTEILNQLSK